jgi:cobaltochelatase CobT
LNNEKEESIISTIKAISKNDQIEIEFNDEEINFSEVNQNQFLGPKISLPKINDNLVQSRAFGDLTALYLKFHNQEFQQFLPDENSQKLFDDFEKFRVINLGSQEFKGIKMNLERPLQQQLEAIDGFSFLPFLILENSSLNLETHRRLIGKELLSKISQLTKLVQNQEKFATKSLEIIEFLNKETGEKSDQDSPENNPEKNPPENNPPQKNQDENDEKADEENQSATRKIDQKPQKFEIEENTSKETAGTKPKNITDSAPENGLKFVPKYQVFTKKFDQIIKAEDLAEKQELADLRLQLDFKFKNLKKISKKLTAKLKRKLLAKKEIFFEFDQEEGILDSRKIPQIIANPLRQNNYLTIKENDHQNTILSILIDNSGSMRGSPIAMSAMAAEIITQIFEGFAIKTEILGFTTVDWRGGQSRKLWESSGKPENAGRLSDLRHIIYKNANQSFKRSKNNLALMLKNGILKENIDGEALIWAANRLRSRPEERKILLVISDGTPVDDATNSNNENNILNDHLHQVIAQLEKHSKIEIAAIGIGHEVGDFYHNSIMVKNVNELGDVMVEKICDLL